MFGCDYRTFVFNHLYEPFNELFLSSTKRYNPIRINQIIRQKYDACLEVLINILKMRALHLKRKLQVG